jgi:glutamate/aspartate transport system substrate-binding protein
MMNAYTTLCRLALAALVSLAVAGTALAQQAAAPARPDLGPTLNRVAGTGNLYLGHREAAIPFSYVMPGLENNYVFGYSWDICQRVVEAVGKRVGRPVQAVPVSVSANNRLMMVKTGMADIECGATTNNVARQKQVAFSVTFYVSEVRVMVRNGAGIQNVAGLAGKRVVTTAGATSDRLIKAAALTENITLTYLVGRDHGESMAMLQRGEADAFVADDAILGALRASSPAPTDFVFLPGSLAKEPYGLVLRREDPQFKQLVDETLIGLMQSGELAKIYDKWFMQPIPPVGAVLEMPMSDLLKAAIANPNDKPAN